MKTERFIWLRIFGLTRHGLRGEPWHSRCVRIAGGYRTVGRDPGEAITDDYPGEPPYTFPGGTINRVAVDVSGDAYVDLEREAALMIMRE